MKLISIYILASLIIAIYGEPCTAQDFFWKSEVPYVHSDGYYRIHLSPEIVSKLNQELGDIRLYGPEMKEVPYIMESEMPLNYKDYFVEYKIIEKKEQLSWPYYTRIVIHNPAKSRISNIHLIIKNSDVSKSLKLSGSDDNKNWYIIKDNYRFHAMYSDMESSVIKILDFPLSNYEYYEILIDDWKNNPINVLNSGYYNTSVEKGKYSVIKSPSISQFEIKNEKLSLIKLKYDDNQLIDKITFDIEGPGFYFRNAEIQVQDSVLNRRNSYEYVFRTIADVVFSSNAANTFYFNSLSANVLYLRISNKDDQALKIKSVETAQLNHYLVCNLKASEKYQVLFGNKELHAPEYDIKFFSEKIPKELVLIRTSEIKSTGIKDSKQSKGLFLDIKFIWFAIILVVALLLFMISKMLKDMKNKHIDNNQKNQ